MTHKSRLGHEWAAWGLISAFVASAAATIFVYGIWSGIVVKVIIGYVYVRGWLATLDYEELTQIAQAAAANTEASFQETVRNRRE